VTGGPRDLGQRMEMFPNVLGGEIKNRIVHMDYILMGFNGLRVGIARRGVLHTPARGPFYRDFFQK
jgi:hypothetical protein